MEWMTQKILQKFCIGVCAGEQKRSMLKFKFEIFILFCLFVYCELVTQRHHARFNGENIFDFIELYREYKKIK